MVVKTTVPFDFITLSCGENILFKKKRERENVPWEKEIQFKVIFSWEINFKFMGNKHLWQLQKILFLKKCGNFGRIFFKKIPCSSLHTITSIGHEFILFFKC
jgi:hypothetical protein